ncbi:MAG TPA: c-type cytochrome [Anaerolineales bacterium]|nr:c-type cytochrome [Anaerolineales bacterium]
MSDHSRKYTLWFAALLLMSWLFTSQSFAQAQTPPPNEDLAEGALLYEQNCIMCHGPYGEGRVGATLAKNWPSIRPDLTVRTIITNGVPGTVMPPWSETKGGPLSESQIDSLVAFILSWQSNDPSQIIVIPTATLRPAITPIPEVQGDPNRGAVLFDQNCAVCHGANGEGRVGAVLAKNWPAIRPDLAVRTTIQNGIPGSVMPAWSLVNGGPLSDGDINDLTAYILSLQNTQRPLPSATIEPPQQPSVLQGWLGILVFIVLLAAVLIIAFWIQRKKS